MTKFRFFGEIFEKFALFDERKMAFLAAKSHVAYS